MSKYVAIAGAVLCIALCVIAADPQPVWPSQFYIQFEETTKVLSTDHMKGYMYYDEPNGRELIYRDSGKGDRYCGSVKHEDTPCTHLVRDGKRFLIFPQLKYCCMCCTAEKGCGVVKSSWLEGATYNGTETVNGQTCQRFEKKGLQPNYYSQNDQNVPCRLLQEPNDDQLFMQATYKPGPFDDSLFTVPDYCEKSCPLLSICTIA